VPINLVVLIFSFFALIVKDSVEAGELEFTEGLAFGGHIQQQQQRLPFDSMARSTPLSSPCSATAAR
jgi:hypothetical protein